MRLWHLFVPFIAISSLSAGYDAWRKSPPSKATLARHECFATGQAMGLRRSESVELCNCLFGKARWYKWTHWNAEYTREVHMGLAKECVSQMAANAAASQSSGFGTFTSPATSNRMSRPAAETPWGEAPDTDAETIPANRAYTAPPKQYGDPGYE